MLEEKEKLNGGTTTMSEEEKSSDEREWEDCLGNRISGLKNNFYRYGK